jgi:hypothetical protein
MFMNYKTQVCCLEYTSGLGSLDLFTFDHKMMAYGIIFQRRCMPNRFISLPIYSFNPLINFDDLRRLLIRRRTVLTARISMGRTIPWHIYKVCDTLCLG